MLPLVKIASGFAAVSGNIGTPRAISLAVGESGGIASMMTTTGTAAAGTSLLSSTTPHFLHNIRGGAAAALVDLSRENLHIQGIATYGVITALIMNAALRIWTSTSFSTEQKTIVPNLFNVATVICMMTGVFTAIMFQLLTIYSKSALGMGNDAGYIAFKAATKSFRIWGFRCFLAQMVSFVAVFLTRLYNALWESARKRNCDSFLTNTGKAIFAGAILSTVLGSALIQTVLDLASKHIF